MNLFALPPGVDFANEFLNGIDERLGDDPLAWAKVEIWVNTARTRRRLIEIFQTRPACFLPKISLVTELAPPSRIALPQSIPSLSRRLELRKLVAKLVEFRPELAGNSSIMDLTDSLELLLIEMADEHVTPEMLRSIDVQGSSGHWQESLRFLSIGVDNGIAPDRAFLGREIVDAIVRGWDGNPPDHPIFLAGSTGSRGPVAALMRGLLAHSNGHVILPGFDFDMPQDVWQSLGASEMGEDHPQFRYQRLMSDLGIASSRVGRWTKTAPIASERNRLISLALRPAPTTDSWMRDGPNFVGLDEACRGLSIIEAPSPVSEALSIALCLRKAAEDGKVATLITPDRRLARRVTAALDRWRIIPDDSAGISLALTAEGRLLRIVSSAFSRGLTPECMIAMLSNPMVANGENRPRHLNQLSALEGYLRDQNFAGLQSVTFSKWQKRFPGADLEWFDWLLDIQRKFEAIADATVTEFAERLLSTTEALSSGPWQPAESLFFEADPGKAAAKLIAEIIAADKRDVQFSPQDFEDFFTKSLARVAVREATNAHPNIMIWGTLEARVQTVDLAILGGLVEGVWPKHPDPDPWLSRAMRQDVGLLSPERRVGLAAHDFQTAIGAKEVVLSRAVRDEDAMTVPSRWLNRLTNLVAGLPDLGGDGLLNDMLSRGNMWIEMAAKLDRGAPICLPAPRPSIIPPLVVRPTNLSVTQIKTLVRDPYAIYVQKVLGIFPLGPLRFEAGPRLKGIVFHDLLHRFVETTRDDATLLTTKHLLNLTQTALKDHENFPAIARQWRGQIESWADEFVEAEVLRQSGSRPDVLEEKGHWSFDLVDGSSFTLTGVADRIDLDATGTAHVFDYKTGSIPSKLQQKHFDKQLLLLALMAGDGAFNRGQKFNVRRVGYLCVGRALTEDISEIDSSELEGALADIRALLGAYRVNGVGFTARAKMERKEHASDFDHLSRRGEWNEATVPTPIRVGLE